MLNREGEPHQNAPKISIQGSSSLRNQTHATTSKFFGWLTCKGMAKHLLRFNSYTLHWRTGVLRLKHISYTALKNNRLIKHVKIHSRLRPSSLSAVYLDLTMLLSGALKTNCRVRPLSLSPATHAQTVYLRSLLRILWNDENLTAQCPPPLRRIACDRRGCPSGTSSCSTASDWNHRPAGCTNRQKACLEVSSTSCS